MFDQEQRKLDRQTVLDREKKELQATYRLWHKRIRVLVPRYASLTPEQLKYYGTCYSDGLSKEERSQYNSDSVYMWMSPIRQIALYAEGIPISYPNRMIAISIYQDIKQHIQNWNDLISRSLNSRYKAPPVEDFELMLEFAENLEAYLEYYYHHIKTKDFAPFHKRTMNRFVNTDRYAHRADSTYTKLREGVYSFTSNRVPRKESIASKVVVDANPSHYQEQPILTSDDLNGLGIRGGRPV